MQPVATATATELIKLEPVRLSLFVLCRHVIALFALSALQNNIVSSSFSHLIPLLLHDLCDGAGTDCATALSDCKAEAFFHSDGSDQLDLHLDVVARHDHLDSGR